MTSPAQHDNHGASAEGGAFKIELARRFDDKVMCRIDCTSFDDGTRKLGRMLDADHRFGDWREHYARHCASDLPNISLWSIL